MPTTLSGAISFDPVVVPNDTEAATAASLRQFAQPLTNRTAWLQYNLASPTFASGSTSNWVSGATGVVGGTFNFTSGSALNLASGSVLACNANVNFYGGFNASAGIALSAYIYRSGTASMNERVAFGGNADATYGVNDGDIIYVTPGLLTTTRTYTLSHTAAGNGNRIKVMSSNTQTLVVNDATGGFLASIRGAVTTTMYLNYCDFVFIGSQWVICGGQPNP